MSTSTNVRAVTSERTSLLVSVTFGRRSLSLLTLPVDPDAADAHFSRVGTDQGKHPRPSGLNQGQIRCT